MSIAFVHDDDVHVSTFPGRGIAGRRRPERRAFMRRRETYPVSAYLAAVVELQRIWRGIILRRRVIKKYVDNTFSRRWKLHERVAVTAYHHCAKAPERDFPLLLAKVQLRWRAVLIRDEFTRLAGYDRWAIYFVAATTLQRAWIDYSYRVKRRRHRRLGRMRYATKTDSAAASIQFAWRGWINRQVFSFFKKLIRFREAADPVLTMKAINPGEAFLMDPAAGLHVRFRLAGSNFPPIVVYKVATHRPVADIGSFAPRDYTLAKSLKPARCSNNHLSEVDKAMKALAKDKTYWYHRVDNNDWRPVNPLVMSGAATSASSQRSRPAGSGAAAAASAIALNNTLASLVEDGVVAVLPHPAVARYFYNPVAQGYDREGKRLGQRAPLRHWNSSVRKEQQATTAKRTRRKWLVELYASEQASTRHLSREAVLPEAETYFATLTDDDVQRECDSLLQWSDALSFDAYRASWQGMATTLPTEAAVPQRHFEGGASALRIA